MDFRLLIAILPLFILIAYGIVTPDLRPFVHNSLHLGDVAYGLALGIPNIAPFLAGLLLPKIGKLLGEKWTVLTILLLGVLSNAFYGLCPSIAVILVTRFFASAALIVISVLRGGISMLTRVASQQTTWLAVIQVQQGLGYALGPLISYFIQPLGHPSGAWKLTASTVVGFITCGSFLIGAVLVMFTDFSFFERKHAKAETESLLKTEPEDEPQEALMAQEVDPEAPEEVDVARSLQQASTNKFEDLRSSHAQGGSAETHRGCLGWIRNPPNAVLASVGSILTIAANYNFSSLEAAAPPLIAEVLHVEQRYVSFLLVGFGIVFAAMAVLARVVMHYMGLLRCMYLWSLFTLVGPLWCIVYPGETSLPVWRVIIGYIFVAMAYGFVSIGGLTVITRVTPEGKFHKYQGRHGAVMVLSRIAGPIMGGAGFALDPTVGSPTKGNPVFIVGSGLAFIALVWAFIHLRSLRARLV